MVVKSCNENEVIEQMHLTSSRTFGQGRGFSRTIPQLHRSCGMQMSQDYLGFTHAPNTIVMIPPFNGQYSVSQPPGRGPVPGPGMNYTGPREACYKISLVQLLSNLNVILYLSTCHTVYISVLILFIIMP